MARWCTALAARGADVNGRSNVLEPPKRDILGLPHRQERPGAADAAHHVSARRADAAAVRGAPGIDRRRAGADRGRRRRRIWRTPTASARLVLAIRNGHYDVAALLVEKGANVERRRPRQSYAAVHGGGHAHARLDSEPAGAQSRGRASTAWISSGCCSRRAPIPTRSLSASAAGLEGRRHRRAEHVRQRRRCRDDALRARRQERRPGA